MDCEDSIVSHAFMQLASYEAYYDNMYAGLSDNHKKMADEKRVEERGKVLVAGGLDGSLASKPEVKHAFDQLALRELDLDRLDQARCGVETMHFAVRMVDLAREQIAKVAKEAAGL